MPNETPNAPDYSLFGQNVIAAPSVASGFAPTPIAASGPLSVADELWIGAQSEEVQMMFRRLTASDGVVETARNFGYDDGYAAEYDAGHDDGRDEGYAAGRRAGLEEARAERGDDGTTSAPKGPKAA